MWWLPARTNSTATTTSTACVACRVRLAAIGSDTADAWPDAMTAALAGSYCCCTGVVVERVGLVAAVAVAADGSTLDVAVAVAVAVMAVLEIAAFAVAELVIVTAGCFAMSAAVRDRDRWNWVAPGMRRCQSPSTRSAPPDFECASLTLISRPVDLALARAGLVCRSYCNFFVDS